MAYIDELSKPVQTSEVMSNLQQERYNQNNGIASGGSGANISAPKIFDDKRVTGLLDTFNSLMERAQGTHKTKAAQIYGGLANVVGGMINDVMTERGHNITASTAMRGQDITAATNAADLAERQKYGLSKLSMDAAQLSETSQYHKGMLDKMSAELGLNQEKFANEKSEFAVRSGLEQQKFAEEQKRTGIEQGRLDVARDVATSGKMESAIAQQENIYAKGKISAQAKLGELGQTPGWFGTGWGAGPTKAQSAVDALEVQRQSGLESIYKRYGVNPNTGTSSSVPADNAVPYWKQLLGSQ